MPLTYLQSDGSDKLKVREIDGCHVFPWEVIPNHDEEFRSIPKWKARDDDVIICAYPKSGTHWVYEIIYMLLLQKAERVKTYKINGTLDRLSQSQYDEMPSPRVLASHAPFAHLPMDFIEKKCKIIHLVRNPKDVAVSFYHHHVGVAKYEYDGKWEDYLPRFVKGQVDYSSWFDYTLEWEKTIGDPDNSNYPIHVMYYEDMVENLHTEIFKVAQFLGVETHSTLDFVQNIVSLCTLEKMREEKESPESISMWKDNSAGTYRKGIVGDWKNMFSVQQNDMFNEYYKERMKDSKLKIRFSIPVKNMYSVFH